MTSRTGVNFGLQQTAAPGATAVSASECKTHARIQITDDDTWITSRITGATEMVEAFLSRQLIDATWQYTLPGWPPSRTFVLPRPPLSSVTTVEYIADSTTDHTYTTLTASGNYFVDTASDPGRIRLEEDITLPTLSTGELAPVRVTYVAGYGTAGTDVPDTFLLALLQTVHQWYERPETMADGLPMTVQHLLWPYRSTFSDIDGW